MTRLGTFFRRSRFFLATKLGVPIAAPAFRLLARTWRRTDPPAEALAEAFAAPRLIAVTFHGMLLTLIAFRQLVFDADRRMCVMLSPSLDGRLAAAALGYLGIDPVFGTVRSRSVAGSLEFIRRIRAGSIGIIAADGPRGPCGVAKRGCIKIAAAADAHIVLGATSAHRAIPLGSWDRARLPIPFTRIGLSTRLLPPPAVGDEDRMLPEVQDAMVDLAQSTGSPVLPRLPRELRRP
jgi:lysophospholipid acyltransferase (LPLAT)-like uncharacterized protein